MARGMEKMASVGSESFCHKVYELTQQIPRGRVSTYKAIARKLGSRAYRAVGSALKRNSHPIVIPCHRVVNSSGFVGKYSGPGGRAGKIRLLESEGIVISRGKVADFNRRLIFWKKHF